MQVRSIILAAALMLAPLGVRAEVLLGVAGPLTGPNAWLGELTHQGFDTSLEERPMLGAAVNLREEGCR